MAWQFWIDRGGTFTDIVAVSPAGALTTSKLLSVDPAHYDDAAVHGMRKILGLRTHESFPREHVAAIKVGTTVATNALLERKGERTALAVTAGFGDALRIGTQNRPRLFDLNIVLPDMLYSRVIEITERISAHGEVLTLFDKDRARDQLAAVRREGYNALAIVLMHADRYPAHEKMLERLAHAAGFGQISVSHQVNPVMKIIGRGDTTVADAYLSPVLRRYVDTLQAKTNGAPLYFMQSSGGLAAAARFSGKDAVLSGPAGGVVGALETARGAGYHQVIGFDMGGTSTDVSYIAGEPERAYETSVAGVRLRVPMMKIHTVAAGGGSICGFDGLRLSVGPGSAGSHPGPASYRKGGPVTVTDCNVLLGKIQPEHFPRVFGPNADEPLDRGIVERLFADLVKQTGARSAEALAEDFIAIAVDNMARAIKRVSIEQGHDTTNHALACFGGAGGQHACLVAETLDLDTVIIHPLAGVLSALGIGLARQSATRQQTIEQRLSAESMSHIDGLLEGLAAQARAALGSNGQVTVARRVHLRAEGSDTALMVPWASLAEMMEAFSGAYRQKFGFNPDRPVIICERAEAEASDADAAAVPVLAPCAGTAFEPLAHTRLVSKGAAVDAPVYRREALPPGCDIAGPALIVEANATTMVEAGWRATVIADGHLVLTRDRQSAMARKITTARDPALIEIFNNLFMSIAEHMGAVLQSTARSVNIKERLDFSCAIFDGGGNLIANAPHMPVHLGSMGESVRAVREKHKNMLEGESYVLNAPYNGGTHLPDITVITPVMRQGLAAPVFYVACRGHHADVGGITPGSMPPLSRTIDDEGVLLDNIPLVRDGQFLESELRTLLSGGAHPARNIDQNIADLKAQAAANAIGVQQLLAISDKYGLDVVEAYMGHVQDYAEAAVRRAIGKLKSGTRACPMDDGGLVNVSVAIDPARRQATVDFTGTSPQRPTNFNAPRAICRAAVLYVFRTLIDEDIPLNDGCMRPITLIIPPGSMLDPKPPAAVVAGNVETSQIVCDALYGALGILAASQGTMNNFTFGNATHQYYETIAGGAGAGVAFDGASAVQTHMTNSRLTDPEILEWRYPVTLERFAIRENSGGDGAHKGGDGVVRTIRFNVAMTAAILSGRRLSRPFGLEGGQDGVAGITTVHRSNGAMETLGATASADLQPGDAITIATPGGGGFGKARC